MMLRHAPCDVSRTRHPLGSPGSLGSRMVPACHTRPTVPGARGLARTVRVLD